MGVFACLVKAPSLMRDRTWRCSGRQLASEGLIKLLKTFLCIAGPRLRCPELALCCLGPLYPRLSRGLRLLNALMGQRFCLRDPLPSQLHLFGGMLFNQASMRLCLLNAELGGPYSLSRLGGYLFGFFLSMRRALLARPDQLGCVIDQVQAASLPIKTWFRVWSEVDKLSGNGWVNGRGLLLIVEHGSHLGSGS